MEGTQRSETRGRALIIAGVFALVAIGIFLVVWQWPHFFGIDVAEESEETKLTTEEKLAILQQIRASDSEAFTLTTEEKKDAIEEVSQSGGNSLSETEKLDILQSLNAR